MKTIRISDESYTKLVNIRAKLMLRDGKTHSFDDAINEALKNRKEASDD